MQYSNFNDCINAPSRLMMQFYQRHNKAGKITKLLKRGKNYNCVERGICLAIILPTYFTYLSAFAYEEIYFS